MSMVSERCTVRTGACEVRRVTCGTARRMLSIKRIRRYMTDNGPRAKREARVAAVTRMCARATSKQQHANMPRT